ncbi:MAG: GrpB-like predicted nucleotidyltransferase (UPF0157 family) [Myxococcota bacterium]|jgi:GrpB-like predicted nucleotidyltransferase (UPF0157 family)
MGHRISPGARPARAHAYLHLRDRLRTSAEARASYLATERALLAQHPTDRPAYTAGKHDTIRALIPKM